MTEIPYDDYPEPQPAPPDAEDLPNPPTPYETPVSEPGGDFDAAA